MLDTTKSLRDFWQAEVRVRASWNHRIVGSPPGASNSKNKNNNNKNKNKNKNRNNRNNIVCSAPTPNCSAARPLAKTLLNTSGIGPWLSASTPIACPGLVTQTLLPTGWFTQLPTLGGKLPPAFRNAFRKLEHEAQRPCSPAV
ncbi:unnamed protein product [Polarella glacialis]|uniref:Uncharacterized protein n=1 Tax=Polarella glacialis TaxID=89957 RepID=A0A813EWD7_POLGL|nr:unnamed protein product [Polarella glacialis]